MARKAPKLPAKVVRDDTLELIASTKARLSSFEEGSEEYRACQRYIDALHGEAVAEAELDLIYEPIKDLDIVPDNLQAKFYAALDKHTRRMSVSSGALTMFDYALKHTFTAADKDVEQLILDALGANLEALPEEYAKLSGLDRHRGFKQIAGDLMGDWKSERVKVRDNDEMPSAPLCDDCEAEIAA